MNTAWALGKLRAFLDGMAYTRGESYGAVVGFEFSYAMSDAEFEAAAQICEKILDRVVPEWRDGPPPPAGLSTPKWQRHRTWTTRAIAQLEAQEELDANLGPQGPTLNAASLHRWVWDSAATLWDSGHYQEAVQAAARAVNAKTQAKVERRDQSEWKLMTQSFSTADPIEGQPRLRLMEDDCSDTFVNRHEGAGFFARGCYQALRNVMAHEEDAEPEEDYALQALAAFSLLASWVDGAEVVWSTAG